MARPGTFYRGRERSGRIAALLLTALAALILLAIWGFYYLQRYLVYDKDGVRLVFSSGQTDTLSADVTEHGGTAAVDVEIIVDAADYSALTVYADESIESVQAAYVPADALTATLLESYVTGTAPDALLLELKPESGLLAYTSGVALTESYDVNGAVNLSGYLESLREKGVYLIAEISCLADSAMATRNAPAALTDSASGAVLTQDGVSFLDPYSETARDYLSALLTELAALGFDEILLSGLYLPEHDALQFSVDMTAVPDHASAVSSLALYLREEADSLGVRLSAVAECSALLQGGSAAIGQDISVFFKLFDRVAFAADSTDCAAALTALQDVLGDTGAARILPIADGYVPAHDSYAVRQTVG